MSSLIDLNSTVFRLAEVINSDWTFRATTWSKKGAPIRMNDFGTILVQNSFQEEDLEWAVSVAPTFVCPGSWRMSHIMKALGAFHSSTAASKNGWNKDIPFGLTDHIVRIKNIRGIITTFRGV